MYARRENGNAQQECPDKQAVKLNIVLLVDGEEKCKKCGKTYRGLRPCCSDQRMAVSTPSRRAIKGVPSGTGRCPLAGVSSQTAACQTIARGGCQSNPIQKSKGSKTNTKSALCQTSCNYFQEGNAVSASGSMINDQGTAMEVQVSRAQSAQQLSACQSAQSITCMKVQQTTGTSTTVFVNQSTSTFVQQSQPQMPTVCPSKSTQPTIHLAASTEPVMCPLTVRQTTIGSSASEQPTMCPYTERPSTIRPCASAQPAMCLSSAREPTISPSALAQATITTSVLQQPTTCPSVTAQPTICPSATAQPTICPSATAQPTICPSASVQPTITTSVLQQPTICPSISAQPATCSSVVAQPTACPSGSTKVLIPARSCSSILQLSCPFMPSSVEQTASKIGQNAQPEQVDNIPKDISSMQILLKESVSEMNLAALAESAPPMEEPSPINKSISNLEETAQELATSEILATTKSKDIVRNFTQEVSRADVKESAEELLKPTSSEKYSRSDFQDASVSFELQREQSTEKSPMKTKSDDGFDRSKSAKGITEPLPGRQVQSAMAVPTVNRVRNNIDFSLIRSESRLALEQSLSQALKPGLTGLKEFISSRHLVDKKGESKATLLDTDQPHLNKFIDYFIDCDGLRYLGILEQIELDFEDRCKAALLKAQPNTQAEAEFLRIKLNEIAELQPAYQQKTLKELNFPELLAAQIKILAIAYKPKMVAIKRIHEYGLDMEKYWLNEIEHGRAVDKVEIYDIGTQMLSELMGQLFSLLVKSCEFLVQVNSEINNYRSKYTAQALIHLFSEFRRLLVEEVSAVGETCGGVMIKIPQLTDDDIIEIMTKLYSQVNFVDICISKALRAVQPLILLYDSQRR